MENIKNIFDLGNYGFFKDADLTLRISEDNLFDQINPDGWIDIWLGGQDRFIPEIGTFQSLVATDTTFYWDIVDENNKRTKDGIESLFISRNNNMKPYVGDLVPTEPSKTFDFYKDNPAPTNSRLICANLWFYNNLFLDEYFRYYLVLMPKGEEYPNPSKEKVIPMNDRFSIPKDYYIAAYRPREEYNNQLAVMPVIASGKEFSIHFKIKVDLDYLFQNPTAKRKIIIYALETDRPKYMLFPKNTSDIDWSMYQYDFVPEYKRYLLNWGIQQRMPTPKEIEAAKKIRDKYMKYSKMIVELDGFNFQTLSKDFSKKIKDESYELNGLSSYIFPYFKFWYDYQNKDDLPTDVNKILEMIVFKLKPFKGFSLLNKTL